MKSYVVQQDAWDLLRSLPSESIDLVITDIAYESMEVHRKVGTTTRLTDSWFGVIKNEEIPSLLKCFYRVLKPNSHLYFFADERTSYEVKQREFTGELGRYDAPIMTSGFLYWKEIIWCKTSKANPLKADGGMGYHWKACTERILFMEKGKRKLMNLSWTDCQQFPRERNAALPTKKPEALVQRLIENSCPVGGIVLDPFAGTGSTALAAIASGRKFITGDISLKALDPRLKKWLVR